MSVVCSSEGSQYIRIRRISKPPENKKIKYAEGQYPSFNEDEDTLPRSHSSSILSPLGSEKS